MENDLREKVIGNLDNAKANGAFDEDGELCGCTPDQIAGDMVAYAEDVEEEDPQVLVPFIEEWLIKEGMINVN